MKSRHQDQVKEKLTIGLRTIEWNTDSLTSKGRELEDFLLKEHDEHEGTHLSDVEKSKEPTFTFLQTTQQRGKLDKTTLERENCIKK